MDKIAAGIRGGGRETRPRRSLARHRAARGMMTTDTVHKLAGRDVDASAGATIQITGMAKGAAMIGPNMATMLGAGADRRAAHAGRRPSGCSRPPPTTAFNCISVDGHMSTNDTVLLLANGAAGGAAAGGRAIWRSSCRR